MSVVERPGTKKVVCDIKLKVSVNNQAGIDNFRTNIFSFIEVIQNNTTKSSESSNDNISQTSFSRNPLRRFICRADMNSAQDPSMLKLRVTVPEFNL